MKKIFLVTIIVLTLLLTACGGGTETPAETTEKPDSADPAFHYIMGHGAAEGSIGDLYCIKFKELVEAKSNGKITADVYAGSQLGTYGEMLQSLKSGDISAMIFQPAPAVSIIPELAMLDLPYAFYGYTKEEIDEVLNNSEYTNILDESFKKAGYKRMSFAQAATFRETTSSKEVRNMEQFKGLKIRTLENKYHIAFWKNVGASPTPLAFGELYLSLQQGLVDAQENPYDTALAAKFAEVQDYIINTHHIIYPNLFLVNEELYESMPDDYKAIFDEAAVEAKEYAEGLMEDSSTTNLKGLVDAGLESIDFSEEEIGKLKEKADVVKEMLVNDLGDEVVNAFTTALENSKK
ncbi:MAG: TRAP transporter substrate-binding protein [Gudongella sp.]|nr:TRAP transporter substrate-binding protein [Gudongella sp.]